MASYARMLEKKKKPTEEQIARYIGAQSMERLDRLESVLRKRYDLVRVLHFPYGNNYGWGYKYSHERKQLCYAFFEEDAFTVTMQLGDDVAEAVEALLPSLRPEAQALWAERRASGDRGGWIHYRVLDDAAIDDILALLAVKIPPKAGA